MFLSTLFGVKPVDEADDASTERGYPSKKNDDDNTALDSITFPPTLQMPPMPDLHPDHDGEDKILGGRTITQKGKENISEKQIYRGVMGQCQEHATRENRKVYKCKYCKETFTWATKLQAHLLSHETRYTETAEDKIEKPGGGKRAADGLEQWGKTWLTSVVEEE